jgi:hypothetical protein
MYFIYKGLGWWVFIKVWGTLITKNYNHQNLDHQKLCTIFRKFFRVSLRFGKQSLPKIKGIKTLVTKGYVLHLMAS